MRKGPGHRDGAILTLVAAPYKCIFLPFFRNHRDRARKDQMASGWQFTLVEDRIECTASDALLLEFNACRARIELGQTYPPLRLVSAGRFVFANECRTLEF
jgi:hypothetical protein